MRERMKLTKTQLAKVLGVPITDIVRWELNGIPRRDYCCKLVASIIRALPWVEEFNQGRTRFLDWET